MPDLHTDNNTASVEEFTIYDLYSKNITKKEMIDSKSQDKTSLSRSQSSNISMKDLIEFVNAYLNKYKKNDTNNIRFQSMNKLDIPTDNSGYSLKLKKSKVGQALHDKSNN